MVNTPNFRRNIGRLATDRYDFEAHLEGRNPDTGSSYVHGFRHSASHVDIDNPSLVYGNPTDVEEALENVKDFIDTFSSIGQGFVTIGDGYNTWHDADPATINYDPNIASIDSAINLISNYLYSGTGGLTAYDRIKHGGILLVKAGTYIVKDTINIPPGLLLLGEGYGTKFVNATGLVLPTIASNPISVRTPLPISDGDITATSPVQVTTSANDIVTGDKVVISGYSGITITGGGGVNGNVFTVTVVSPGVSFTLDGSTGTGTSVGGIVSFSRPMFNILPQVSPDILRSIDDAAVDPISPFMFAKASKIMNLVISDNFVENTIFGDFNHYSPQNVDTTEPLIHQSAGSNLELLNVYMLGRVQFSVSPAVTSATAHAIKLSPDLNTGTFLKINNCFIDGFSQPISFKSIGGTNDYLEVCDNKIRSHGYLEADGATSANNCIIAMNDNNAVVTSNYLYGNHSLLKTIIYIDSVVSAPNLQAKSKILIAANDLTINKASNSVITPTPLSLNAGITATILTRVSALIYGNVFQDTIGFTVEDASGQFFSTTSENTNIDSSASINLTSANITASASADIVLDAGTTVTINAPTELAIDSANIDSSIATTRITSTGTTTINAEYFTVTGGGFYTDQINTVVTSTYVVDTDSFNSLPDYLIYVATSTIAAVCTITLPAAPGPGRRIIIKDIQGAASTYNISLTVSGGGTIDGVTAPVLLTANWGKYEFISKGIGNDWLML